MEKELNELKNLIIEVAKRLDGKDGFKLNGDFIEYTNENNFKTVLPIVTLFPVAITVLKDHLDDIEGVKNFIEEAIYSFCTKEMQ